MENDFLPSPSFYKCLTANEIRLWHVIAWSPRSIKQINSIADPESFIHVTCGWSTQHSQMKIWVLPLFLSQFRFRFVWFCLFKQKNKPAFSSSLGKRRKEKGNRYFVFAVDQIQISVWFSFLDLRIPIFWILNYRFLDFWKRLDLIPNSSNSVIDLVAAFALVSIWLDLIWAL